MKSTTNAQTSEAVKKNAIAPTWQDCIVEDLSSEAQAAVSGGRMPWNITSTEESLRLFALSGAGIG
jgi:hypothetical protein